MRIIIIERDFPEKKDAKRSIHADAKSINSDFLNDLRAVGVTLNEHGDVIISAYQLKKCTTHVEYDD